MTETESTAAPPEPILFRLKATNQSSVPGEQYFNVFPPLMIVTPSLHQTPIPMVSTATVSRSKPVAALQWAAPTALGLIVLAPGQAVNTAKPTAVTLGSTVAISWKDDVFSVAVTPGTGRAVSVAFDPSIPPSSRVGLVIGPGMILVPIVGDNVILQPDLTRNVSVQFGTPWMPGSSEFSDVSAPTQVTFVSRDAEIVVGPDNLIFQTA